jgi:hypothetical protein
MEQTENLQRTSTAGRTSKEGDSECVLAPEYDKALILYIAEQDKLGLKVQKSFKPSIFRAVVAHVNGEFNNSFTESNVKNHFKFLKVRMRDIRKVLDLSWT